MFRGGYVIARHWFLEGGCVGVNATAVQRDKSVFGYDADGFVPERWLGSHAARIERCMFQAKTSPWAVYKLGWKELLTHIFSCSLALARVQALERM